MTATTPTTPGRPEGPVIHIGTEVIAAIGAHHVLAVPGVTALQPGVARSVVSRTRHRGHAGESTETAAPPSDGVSVTMSAEGTARLEVDVAVRLGVPCLEVAKQIQQRLEAEIRAATGLASVVTVNIVDVTEPEDNDADGYRISGHRS